MATPRFRFRDWLTHAAIRAFLGAMLALPYRWRVPAMGWIMSRLLAPLLKWDRRIRNNLQTVCPELPAAEVDRLCRAVPDNWGRTLIEIFSGRQFVARIKDTPLTGPGADAFRAARAAGRPVILVTGHFGNYDAPRGALQAGGYPLAALYREMEIGPFNTWYVERISAIASPVYPTTRKGLADYVRHLKNKGMIGILIDVHAGSGAPLQFFGKTAYTATSTAEWAVKYNADVFPIYGRRRDDGLSFDIVIDNPVPRGDPVAMTQALNDSLERMVRENMGQWFWIHRRWKAGPPAGGA